MNPVEPAKRSKKIAYEVSGPSDTQEKDSSSVEELAPPEDASLEKVRDILFGAQSREVGQRFQTLESRLLQESTNLREELTRSVEALKVHFTQEVSQLKLQIQTEATGRKTSLADVGQMIQKLSATLEGQLSQLQQQTAQQDAALEGKITQQKADLTQHHDQQMAELQRQLQEGFQLLKSEKTDRAVLAEMLMDVALRLKVGSKDETAS